MSPLLEGYKLRKPFMRESQFFTLPRSLRLWKIQNYFYDYHFFLPLIVSQPLTHLKLSLVPRDVICTPNYMMSLTHWLSQDRIILFVCCLFRFFSLNLCSCLKLLLARVHRLRQKKLDDIFWVQRWRNEIVEHLKTAFPNCSSYNCYSCHTQIGINIIWSTRCSFFVLCPTKLILSATYTKVWSCHAVLDTLLLIMDKHFV